MELRLPAVLTHAQANQCVRALLAALRLGQSGPDVVVNASALRHFDSSALAVLLECRRFCVALDLSFTVAGLPPRLRQLAGLYGVAALMPAPS
jgi:phospholipid transport system transporter-binding protein